MLFPTYSLSEDNNENECRLLKSEFPVRCAHVISTSESSMYEVKPNISSTNNTARMDMRSIMLEFIAHVTTLACFGMSMTETWSPCDSTFHYPSFWCNVHDAILTGAKDFKEDLLEWWNIQVFGDHKGHAMEKMVVFKEPEEESDMDKLRRERAEQKAAEEEQLRLLAAQKLTGEPTPSQEYAD